MLGSSSTIATTFLSITTVFTTSIAFAATSGMRESSQVAQLWRMFSRERFVTLLRQPPNLTNPPDSRKLLEVDPQDYCTFGQLSVPDFSGSDVTCHCA